MACCVIGCKGEPVADQIITFENKQGYTVRTRIQWCKTHRAEGTLEDLVKDEPLNKEEK